MSVNRNILIMFYFINISAMAHVTNSFFESDVVENSGFNGQERCQQTEDRYLDIKDYIKMSKREFFTLLANARNGDASSANSLGMYYDVVPGCYNKAVYWLRIAAKKGYGIAQFNLGSLLLRNQTKDSYTESIHWLELAEKNGVDSAKYSKKRALNWLNTNN
ncbi:tetratricopeptide repeat protein [Undibacterium sp. JH2W]|uniref:tetratricopeptide repeat protein n=1 Tax=Undibacterium sp. JH2W TaxID=3413037 RepID=UPI003BF1C2F2